MKNFLSRRLVLASVGSLVLGVGLTAVAFAAIPHSTSKVISACRNNISGALRVVDAQAGASCNFLETGLSWSGNLNPPSGSGAKTVIFYAKEGSSDPDFNYTYEPLRSRGVIAMKKLVANDPTNNPLDTRGYCLKLNFNVLYSNQPFGFVYFPANIEDTGVNIDDACGSGYDVLVGSNLSEKGAVFFSE